MEYLQLHPSKLMLSTTNKVRFSNTVNAGGTTGLSSTIRQDIGNSGKLRQSIDIYESDFGTIDVIPNYVMTDNTTAFIYDSSFLKLATYRPLGFKDIREAGDSFRALMVMEHTLQSDNPGANGAVLAITA